MKNIFDRYLIWTYYNKKLAFVVEVVALLAILAITSVLIYWN